MALLSSTQRTTAFLLALLAGLAFSSNALAQPGGRDRGDQRREEGRRDEGRRDERRGDRRDWRRGGGDRGRDRGRDRGGNWGGRDRDRGGGRDRMQGWVRSWDKDGDGYITKQEVPERMHRFLDRMAQRAGISTEGRIKVEALLTDRSERREQQQSNSMAFGETKELEKPSGFDGAASDTGTSGFIPAKAEELAGARDSADDLIKRYDQNRNGILEREEWSKISGTPSNADLNRDALITRTELINRLIVMRRSRSGEGGNKDRKGGEGRGENRDGASRDKGRSRSSAAKRSYRFTTPNDRIPEAARRWIKDHDRDGDGQVAMHEFSRTWSDRRIREFSRYDANSDGVITPSEYLAKK